MDEEMQKYIDHHEREWDKLSQDSKLRGYAILKNNLDEETKNFVREAHKKSGKEWAIENMIHFGWGMAIRNLLRTNGLTDDQTPSGNLDDYYVQLIEAACDLRHVELTR